MSRLPRLLPALLLALWLPAADRPNIVFILADDLGYAEVGFNGQQKILTPHVDRLAREGLVLSRHYSGNAVCAPSRSVLMTGFSPGHAHARDNRDIGDREQTPLPADAVTVARTLKDAGYATGAFGKWGLGGFNSTGNPMKQGFDRFLGLTSQWIAHSQYPKAIWDDGREVQLDNGPEGTPGHARFPEGADPRDPAAYAPFIGKDFLGDRMIRGAEEFIARHAKAPFFLYYASTLPHVSLQVPEADLRKYDGKFPEDPPFTPSSPGSYVPNRTPRATYAAMITRLDAEVGRLLAALEKAGVADDTLVVFSADNGATHDVGGVETKFFRSVGDLRGLKGSLHEGGVRMPTVVRWPKSCPPGRRSARISGFEDWHVTFAEAAGARAPAKHDGESLLPAIRGQDTPRTGPLYREFAGYGAQQAIWDGRWKAVRTDMLKAARAGQPVTTQLYDLDADPNETTDLAAKFPDVVKSLEAKMSASRVPNPDFPLPGVDPLPANAGKGKKKAAKK
ncbi:MAG: sulfatase-like hydrolase/transferase [Opitutia bacterium]